MPNFYQFLNRSFDQIAEQLTVKLKLGLIEFMISSKVSSNKFYKGKVDNKIKVKQKTDLLFLCFIDLSKEVILPSALKMP